MKPVTLHIDRDKHVFLTEIFLSHIFLFRNKNLFTKILCSLHFLYKPFQGHLKISRFLQVGFFCYKSALSETDTFRASPDCPAERGVLFIHRVSCPFLDESS